MSLVLFLSRLALYLVAIAVPVFHPAVVVGYETRGAFIWFGLMPLEMIIAYALGPPVLRLRTWLLIAALPIAATGIFVGIDASPWIAVSAGTLAFVLTAALFQLGPRLRALFAVEQIALVVLYLRLLAFSRASEDMAIAAQGATQFIFFLIIAAFLLHGIVVSLVLAAGDRFAVPAGPQERSPLSRLRSRIRQARGKTSTSQTSSSIDTVGTRRSGREVAVFLAAAVPMLLLTIFVLPTDFVSHNPVLNMLNPPDHDPPDPLDSQARDLMDRGQARDAGNQSGAGQGADENGGGDESELFGVNADDWNGGTGGDGEEQQRAVMIVRSDIDPTYVADGYRDFFDRSRGFTRTDPEEQRLNDLVRKRLAGTWRNTERSGDRLRSREDIAVYSTLEDRVLAYQPYEVEPTVYRPQFHPFSYSYASVSRVSTAGERHFNSISGLSDQKRAELEEYLDIPLEREHRDAFEAHIDEHIGEIPDGYYERIQAILESFSDFQYELGYEDSFRPDHQANFVANTRSGDCVEFSVTAGILGRLMGIPTRVVTGYLASSGLQNQAHDRGLAVLQDSIPHLGEYSLSEMFLVTTSHRHAWVQYYMPGYGWVDFEPTAYAIPPDRAGDPNERQVVVPIIEERRAPREAGFPWNEVANVLLWLVIISLTALYLYRWMSELYLVWRARGGDDRAVRARYRLLLMHLAASGCELKSSGETAQEYAKRRPETSGFARAYTRLRFMPPDRDRTEVLDELLQEYRSVRRTVLGRSPLRSLRHVLSLRTLYYV